MEQYKSYAATDSQTGEAYLMLEAQYGPTRKGSSFRKWAVCALCGYTAPQSEMLQKGSRFYCTKYGCAEDKSES